MSVKVHDMMASARIDGHSWDDINDTLGQLQGYAASTGLSQLQIARQIGFSDPQLLRDRLSAEAAVKRSWNE